MPEPQRFRTKPVEIDAMRWDGTAMGAIPLMDWIRDNGGAARYACAGHVQCANHHCGNPHWINIDTLEGVMSTNEHDWVIRGVQGEFYPVKAEIFAATYEPVQENRNAR